MKTWKRMLAMVLALAMIIPGVYLGKSEGRKVQAAGSDYEWEEYSVSDAKGYIGKQSNLLKKDGYLFAGWFLKQDGTLDDAITKAADIPEGTQNVYAKFVSAGVLSVKSQSTPKEKGAVIRFVSSVESLNYSQVGFVIEYKNSNGPQTKRNTSNTVYQRIESTTNGAEYEFDPLVVDLESKYFITAKLDTANTAVFGDIDKSTTFTVRSFWKTLDGVEVTGASRYVSLEDGWVDTNTLNLFFEVTGNVAVGDTLQVEAGPGSKAEVIGIDDSVSPAIAHVRVTVTAEEKSSLPSATYFKFSKDKNDVGSTVYRYYYTEYKGDGTADSTWYTAYVKDAGETNKTDFIIATNADLYGLASVVNGTDDITADNFNGKTIHVISDIVANKGYVDKTAGTYIATKNAKGEPITDGTEYNWAMVGNDIGHRFEGTFDGHMHEISGIRHVTVDSANIRGFFAHTGPNAGIKNFKLVNSYFSFGGRNNCGSIVGRAYGSKIDTVYSDAVIIINHTGAGGLVGNANTGGLTMNNCWFDGYLKNNYTTTTYTPNTGGLVGAISGNSIVKNSLNTGRVEANKTATYESPGVGGLIGNVSGTITLENCFNAGTVTWNAAATGGYGAIVGNANSAGFGTATITNTYATTDHCGVAVNGTTDGSVGMFAVSEIAGTNALSKDTKNLFTYVTDAATYANESYWAVVPGEAPVLADFADVAGKGSYQAIDTSWYNKNESTFVLGDEADFYGFSLLSRESAVGGFAGKNIELANDITLNTGDAKVWSATNAPDYQWLCIGPSEAEFNGNFDGQGHKISGVYLNSPLTFQGLFGMVGTGATVQNFSLLNSYLYSTNSQLGSIAGGCKGSFDSIYSDAIVSINNTSARYNLGGLVGRLEGESGQTIINNCWFNGKVIAAGATTSVGGFVGRKQGTNAVAVITNSMNSGTVSIEASGGLNAGCFIGARTQGTITVSNCFNAGELVFEEGATSYGVIIGYGAATATNTYTISQEGVDYKYGTADEKHTLDKTTIYGMAAMDKMPELFTPADGIIYWAVTEKTPVLASFTEYATDAEGNAVSTIAFDTSWYDESQSTYTLYDADDFYGFAMLSKLPELDGFAGKTIRLGADIEINQGDAVTWAGNAPDYKWIGIGEYIDDNNIIPFKGEFDGNNKTIKGIYYNNTETKYGGLFRLTEGATIKNFSLTNSYIASNRDFLGSIVGQATDSSLEQIYSNAVVAGSRNSIGGLIGRILSSTSVVRCWYDGAVTNTGNGTSNRNTGGLVGRVNTSATISNCLNTAEVSAPNYTATEAEGDDSVRAYIGGLVGYQHAGTMSISYSLNTGKISYNEAVTTGYGSVVGRANSGVTINALAAYGTTTSCETAVSKHASATITPDLELVNIVDAALVGDAAKSTKLFAAENAGVWTTVANAAPVLACFANKAVAGTAAIPTRMQVTIQAGQGSVIEKGTISSSIAFTDQGTVTRRQGGCYVVAEDGTTYYYQTFISSYQGNVLGTGDNKDNKVVIVKYKVANGSGTEVKRSAELPLVHANDITYNAKLDLLVVAHANDDMHRVSFIDPDTLEVTGTKYIDGLSYYSIDYNATYGCYVVQTGAEGGKGHNLVILNGNLEIIKVYENGGLYTDPRKVGASTGQGMACDDKYIYCLFSDSSYTHAITVFDWSGNYVTEISFKLKGEPETLSIVENQILVNVLAESKIYNIEF